MDRMMVMDFYLSVTQRFIQVSFIECLYFMYEAARMNHAHSSVFCSFLFSVLFGFLETSACLGS